MSKENKTLDTLQNANDFLDDGMPDKKYVIEALEYALNKCINVDGNAEIHYNTLANAIEVVKNCSNPDVVATEGKSCGYFIPADKQTSATICETCGQEKHFHPQN